MSNLPLTPTLYENPADREAGTPRLTQEAAQALMDNLPPSDQEILALDALGLGTVGIAPYFGVESTAITYRLSKRIYPQIGIEGGRQATGNVYTARKITWISGLLERIAEDKNDESYTVTKSVLERYKLNIEHIKFMSQYALTMQELAVLQLEESSTKLRISERLLIGKGAIDYIRNGLRKKIKPEDRKDVSERAAELGRFALTTGPFDKPL